MSERLARSEEEVEHTRAGLTRKNEELEDRGASWRRCWRRWAPASWSWTPRRDHRLNAAACRLLDVDAERVGRRSRTRCRAGRDEIVGLVAAAALGPRRAQEREVVLPGRGARPPLCRHRGPAARPAGRPPGAVLVLDDLTPLMRAQKVAAWGEVARKLAHEIKNPLTPIQLSAQRVRKAYLQGRPDFEKVLTSARAPSSRGGRAQEPGGRVRAVRAPARGQPAPGSLHDVIDQTLSLYDGLFSGVTMERRWRRRARRAPRPDQMKRVLINLVDNAIEATEQAGDGSRSPPSSTARRAACGWAWPTTAPASPRRPRQALRAALLDQEARAAASAWPSSAASCRSTTG
jgi:two-component system nitrogen regulation sensor histidine kinase NtrY